MKKIIVLAFTGALLIVGCNSKKEVPSDEPIRAQGHEQGNGTDNIPVSHGAAWVYEPNVISYCIQVSSDFGVDKPTASAEVVKAFDTWKQYIVEYKVNEHLEKMFVKYSHNPPQNSDPQVVEKIKKLFRLSTQFVENASCRGNESITFYFGVENDEVLAFKKNYYNPTAFAARTKYSSVDGTSNGFIWLTKNESIASFAGYYPRWDLKNKLLGVLLHEIGHVYGIDHIDGTIMQQEMFGLLIEGYSNPDYQKLTQQKLMSIDHERILFIPDNFEIPTIYTSGLMTFRPNYPKEDVREEVIENYKFLTGKDPLAADEVTAGLYYPNIFIGGFSNGMSRFQLELDENNVAAVAKEIFKVNRSWPQDPGLYISGMAFGLGHVSKSIVGNITNKAGEVVPVVVNLNMGQAPIRITYIKDGKEKALMVLKGLY